MRVGPEAGPEESLNTRTADNGSVRLSHLPRLPLRRDRLRRTSAYRGLGMNISWIKEDDANDDEDADEEAIDEVVKMLHDDMIDDGADVGGTEDLEQMNGQTLPGCDSTMEGNESGLTSPLIGGSTTAPHQNSERGDSITDTYVFALEVVSDHQLRFVIALIYIIFFTMLAIENAFNRVKEEGTVTILVRPENATGHDRLCCYDHNGHCTPDEHTGISVEQADLLVNTVVVSDGIDSSDWIGNGAKPGSPPFSAHAVSGTFMTGPSSLDFEANSALHPFWDDIVAVVWAGASEYENNFHSVSLSLQLEKFGGEWPANITDQLEMPLYAEFFSCVRGKEGFCDSVGNWRKTIVVDKSKGSINATVEGSTIRVDLINSVLDFFLEPQIIQRTGGRYVLRADPGGAVADCLQGKNCIASLIMSGPKKTPVVGVWICLGLVTIYTTFFVWWIFRLYKLKGKITMWPRENWWLLLFGVGFILQANYFQLGLDISAYYSSSFALNQKVWYAADIISRAGMCCMVYSWACFYDSPRRYIVDGVSFHKYKILYITMLFASTLITRLFKFPGASWQDEPGTDLEIGGIGFGTEYYMWKNYDQVIASVASITFCSLVVFGYIYFGWKTFRSFQALDNIPFGMTQRAQLSFRVFFWTTSLAIISTIVYMIRDFFVYATSEYNMISLHYFVNFVNLRNFYMYIFHVTILITFQLFFLPPSVDKVINKSRTHHVTEVDAESRKASEESERNYLMVLDRAMFLCICSKEVYLPFSEEEWMQRMSRSGIPKTASRQDEDKKQSVLSSVGSDSSSSLSSTAYTSSHTPRVRIAGAMLKGLSERTWSSGFRVVARIREEGGIDLHDTRAIIFRNEFSGDLVVAFRGTLTGKQVKTDLMISRVAVCLDTFLARSYQGGMKICTKDRNKLTSNEIESKLHKGEITNVRLIDIIPKNNEERPSYLEKAHKSQKKIPGTGKIHFGFWSSYNRVRKNIHNTVRKELIDRPGKLMITGHSLGGALATLCAYDMCRWVLPTVKRQIISQHRGGTDQLEKLKLSCYTFGSPRVGGPAFADAYNKVVPNTQRIVCDGDVITSGPPTYWGYKHVGRENVIDFTGNIRVNPALVEKNFALKSRNRASSHRMTAYLGVIKKLFHPIISDEEELLSCLAEKYGLRLNS